MRARITAFKHFDQFNLIFLYLDHVTIISSLHSFETNSENSILQSRDEIRDTILKAREISS